MRLRKAYPGNPLTLGVGECQTRHYLAEMRQVLALVEDDLVDKVDRIASILITARSNNKTVFIMGNGGSATTASHFVADLSKLTIAGGVKRFRVIGLVDNIATILAWANDTSYERIFVEQLKNLMNSGDVVIGFSGSGNSMNVIKAIEYANEKGGVTVGLCGFYGGKLSKCAKECFVVPCVNMQRIEDVHLIIVHLLTSLIKAEQEQDIA